MKRICNWSVLAMIVLLAGLATMLSCTKEDNAPYTLSVTEIGAGWAKLSGRIKDLETYSNTSFIVFWDNDKSVLEGTGQKGYSYCTVSDGKLEIELLGLIPETTYYYMYGPVINQKIEKSDILSFKTKALPNGNIDMGTGILWASCNLGAKQPEEIGDHFAWGETAPKTSFSWDNYQWYQDGAITLYSMLSKMVRLDPEEDAAHVILGGKWRMPSKKDMEELSDVCSLAMTKYRGVPGMTLTSRITRNSLFFPAELQIPEQPYYKSQYWQSDRSDVEDTYARGCKVTSSINEYYGMTNWVEFDIYGLFERCTGGLIRPVMDLQ